MKYRMSRTLSQGPEAQGETRSRTLPSSLGAGTLAGPFDGSHFPLLTEMARGQSNTSPQGPRCCSSDPALARIPSDARSSLRRLQHSRVRIAAAPPIASVRHISDGMRNAQGRFPMACATHKAERRRTKKILRVGSPDAVRIYGHGDERARVCAVSSESVREVTPTTGLRAAVLAVRRVVLHGRTRATRGCQFRLPVPGSREISR